MIITALGNEEINNKLKDIYKDKVYLYDLYYREDVISFLKKNSYDSEETLNKWIIITKENLEGDMNFKEYIEKIREISKDIRIICFVEILNDENKTFLFSKDIFDIIEGNLIKIDKIESVINSDKKVIYKENIGNKEIKKSKLDNENSIVISKELFAVYGTSGSGKSFFSSLIAKKISEKLNINVALLDMDIQNPNLDILVNAEGDSNLLSQIVEDVDKRGEISDIITKYLIKDKKNKNLSYMTSNVSLFECQNKLSNKYYEKIYSSVNQNYDYTIVDLPSAPFLDVVSYTLTNSTKIFFVINANYISIRQAIKYLDLITKLWNVPSEKIALIINKCKKNSLSISQI